MSNSTAHERASLENSVSLSVILPAYNEEQRLRPTLESVCRFLSQRGTSFEVIVVDDGSSDNTKGLVEDFASSDSRVRCLALHKNAGKGRAVKEGVLHAHGARIVFADADGSTPIEEIDRLSAALDAGADMAIGSRALASSETRVEALWYRKLLGRIFNKLINLIIVPGIADTQCGFKLFTRRAAQFLFARQTAERFSFDVELLFIAQRAGLRISEVPVNWHNVPGSKVHLLTDACHMFMDACRFRWRHRNISALAYRNFQENTAAS